MILFFLPSLGLGLEVAGSSCIPQVIENGNVDNRTGEVSCSAGFTRLGADLLQCKEGQWNSEIPLCVDLDGCREEKLPNISHGYLKPFENKRFGGMVLQCSCDIGYRRMGSALVYCNEGEWNPESFPVCTKTGCNESLVDNLENGRAIKKAAGAIFTFECEAGKTLRGSSLVFCDGHKWNDTVPLCTEPTLDPFLSVIVDGNVSFGDIITLGSQVTLVCLANSGHPTPMVSLYKNDKPIGDLVAGENTYSFIAEAQDNWAFFRCDAINIAMEKPKQTEMMLNIEYEPRIVKINAPAFLIADKKAEFICTSDESNPSVDLVWDGMNQDIENYFEVVSESKSKTTNGWVTTSRMNLLAPSNGEVQINCSSGNIIDTKRIPIYYPPSSLVIEGPNNVVMGDKIVLKCQSRQSEPPTILRWVVTQSKERKNIVGKSWKEVDDEKGWSTFSMIEIVPAKKSNLVVECFAKHQTLGGISMGVTHIIDIDAVESSSVSTINYEPTKRENVTIEDELPLVDETSLAFDSIVTTNFTNIENDSAEAGEFLPRDNLTEALHLDDDKVVSDNSGDIKVNDFAAKQVLIKGSASQVNISSSVKICMGYLVFILIIIIRMFA